MFQQISLNFIRFLSVGLNKGLPKEKYTLQGIVVSWRKLMGHTITFISKTVLNLPPEHWRKSFHCDHWSLHWCHIYICVCMFCFLNRFYYVVQAVLELAIYVDQVGLKLRSICLCYAVYSDLLFFFLTPPRWSPLPCPPNFMFFLPQKRKNKKIKTSKTKKYQTKTNGVHIVLTNYSWAWAFGVWLIYPVTLLSTLNEWN